MKKFAVIDVGSNSVRLLFVADGNVLYKQLETTRLGEGIAQIPRLKAEAIERTAQAVVSFFGQAKAEGAEGVFAFATAAVRAAENGRDFVARVEELCGLSIEVVSGETEAEIGILGALGNEDGAVVDIGGASTEIVVKKQGELVYKKSVNIGVVRINDLCGGDISKIRACTQDACKQFEGVPADTPLYGIGGTATTLAARYLGLNSYDGAKITGAKISAAGIAALAEKFSRMTVEQIAALPCMPAGRADVITGGAIWLATLLQTLGFDEMIASDRDNLEGYAVKNGWME